MQASDLDKLRDELEQRKLCREGIGYEACGKKKDEVAQLRSSRHKMDLLFQLIVMDNEEMDLRE